MNELPRIMLLIEASRQAGRGMLIGISQYAKLHGPFSFYRQLPFYQTFASTNRKEKGLARIIRQWHPDGIIIEAPSIKDPEDIIPQGTKAVFVPIRKLVPGFGNLVDDQGQCGRKGAEHFLDRGFVNLAYCGYDYIYWSEERSRAYCQRARQAGLEVHMYHQPISKLRTWEKEMPYLINWLTTLPKPVGIMVCNDDRAQFLIEACKTADLHSPEDVAILGVDNDTLICSLSDPPLSSLSLNFEKAGFEMAEMLHHMITGDWNGPDQVVLQSQRVHTRQSTDILAVNNPELARALAYIRRHATDGIGIDHVVRQISVSRRMLERYFQQYLGRSIHREILRVQMHAIEKRLVETNLPVSKIAQTCGFATPEYMGQVFKRQHNMTMLQFRRESKKGQLSA
jgi:LacI family transcriptional regulator